MEERGKGDWKRGEVREGGERSEREGKGDDGKRREVRTY